MKNKQNTTEGQRQTWIFKILENSKEGSRVIGNIIYK